VTDSPMLTAALAYAARGWPVFPCDPRVDAPDTPAAKRRSKRPLVKGADKDAEGKDIPHTGGLWRATTDAGQIREWWRHWPNALIGLPTGSRSGVFVIDLDPKEMQLEAVLRTLTDAVGPLPQGPRSLTQSGGMHIWFAICLGDAMPKNSAKRLERIDWRGDGGYVIVPPSTMADGKSYKWIASPDELEFPAPPARLLDLVFQRGEFARQPKGAGDGTEAPRQARPVDPANAGEVAIRKYALAALDRAKGDVATARQGNRGHTLNAAAYGVAGFVGLSILSEREVYAALQDGADACGLTGTDGSAERDAKIRRGLAAGIGNTVDLDRRLDEIRREHQLRASYRRPEAPRGREAGASRPASDAAPSSGGGGGDGPPPVDPGDDDDAEPDPEVAAACSRLAQNDTGNGHRFIAWFGRRMLNVRDVGEHVWCGSHWQPEGGKEAWQRYAQTTAERIAIEALYIEGSRADVALIASAEPLAGKDPDDLTDSERDILRLAGQAEDRLAKRRGDRRKFAVSSGNTSRISGMIAQAVPHMTVAPEEMDRDPLAINVLNGTVRLVKEVTEEEDPDCPDPDVVRLHKVTRWRVRLDPHNREDRISKVMPVAYDPKAKCPKWLAFMERFQPTEPIRRFLQLWHGYGLTGLMGEQAFVYNYGLGANGKSTFMDTIARLQGPYAQSLPAEALTGDQQRRGDQATPEYARLPGARLVRCAELPRGQGFRESTLKMLTGGEPILVRHLNKGFFEFRPTFKTIGSGNDRPSIGGVDEGIWRRMKLVPWKVIIPPAERRPMEQVIAEFMAEGSGILNWLLEGLAEYLLYGLAVPDEIQAATDDYRNDMDPIGEFTRACVHKEAGHDETARSMYLAYVSWCHANSVKPFTEKTFATIMVQKAFEKTSGRIRLYRNVRLVEVPADPESQGQPSFAPYDS